MSDRLGLRGQLCVFNKKSDINADHFEGHHNTCRFITGKSNRLQSQVNTSSRKLIHTLYSDTTPFFIFTLRSV